MDIGYTYASQAGERIAVYAPPSFAPPEALTFATERGPVEFARVSDRELTCGVVPGVSGRCDSYECHRARLGECMCGRHRGLHAAPDDERPGIRIRKAVSDAS